MLRPVIFTHRGLQPSTTNFFAESSYEAFASQLQAGFGLEFDFNLTKDNQIVILHDHSLSRMTNGKDLREVKQVLADELHMFSFNNGRICFFDDLAPLLSKSTSPLNAFHIKGALQDQASLYFLIKKLEKWPSLFDKLLIFDLKPSTAEYIKKSLPQLHLAPSVAQPFDIKRFNSVVKNTLLSVEEAITHKDLFDWIWLDEWDLQNETGFKQLYTLENFALLRHHNFKISLVTPELHSSSTGLLGGEAHADAQSTARLFERIKEIISLQPDAICTDYPIEVNQLINH